MKIKVCGMREPDNIRAIEALGVDMIGFIFWRKSPRCVPLAGTAPYNAVVAASRASGCAGRRAAKVGVFVDDTPQDIISAVSNFGLDYVQLHGNETPAMIENLRKAIGAGNCPNIKIIKAISVGAADDVKRWREYRNTADLLLFDTKGKSVGGNGKRFDWSVLDAYAGDIPFLLSGGIGPDDAADVLSLNMPKMVGIDLNSRFETAPGVKDVAMIKKFVETIKGSPFPTSPRGGACELRDKQ